MPENLSVSFKKLAKQTTYYYPMGKCVKTKPSKSGEKTPLPDTLSEHPILRPVRLQWETWDFMLAAVVCKFYPDVRTYRDKLTHPNGLGHIPITSRCIVWYGNEKNVAKALSTFMRWSGTILGEALASYGQVQPTAVYRGVSTRLGNAWAMGCLRGLFQRARVAQKDGRYGSAEDRRERAVLLDQWQKRRGIQIETVWRSYHVKDEVAFRSGLRRGLIMFPEAVG